jgi:hypothetical protein
MQKTGNKKEKRRLAGFEHKVIRGARILLAGFEKTSSIVPQGRQAAEMMSTLALDCQNLRKRSSMNRKTEPAAMLKTESPTWSTRNTTKTT